jgi:hypothetical protein
MGGRSLPARPVARALFAAFTACAIAAPALSQAMGKLISLRPAGRAGIFDPSLADTASGQRAWMSYSAVDPSPRWPTKNTRTVATRLAYSNDLGARWTDLGFAVNNISEAAGGSEAQTWNNEVSSLVFDPWAPGSERWKLFWHHYLEINDKGRFQHGWIAYKAASTPGELRDAPEVKLFAGRAYASVDNNPLGESSSPLGGAPLVNLSALHRDLDLCVAASEPGAIATESGLYLALSCYRPRAPGPLAILIGGAEPIVVLLKCDAPCHPTRPGAWRYINTLLTPDDARAAGGDKYTASDLFAQNGKYYIIVSPVTNRPVNGAYNGCHVFGFTDIASGRLQNDGAHPTILKRIQGDPDTFNGACTYAQNVTVSGFMYGQIRFDGRPYFQIFQTGIGM